MVAEICSQLLFKNLKERSFLECNKYSKIVDDVSNIIYGKFFKIISMLI